MDKWQVFSVLASSVTGILAVVLGYISNTRKSAVDKLNAQVTTLEVHAKRCEDDLKAVEREVRNLLVEIALRTNTNEHYHHPNPSNSSRNE